MKLSNFEDYIENVILERGWDYFEKGRIDKLNEVEKGHFIVEVIGTDSYIVDVFTDGLDEIVETFCDCPYDWGEYCKHQAATFFALREARNTETEPTKEKVDLNTILSNLKREELVTIILNISNEYKEIEKSLLFKYAPTKDEIALSKKLIREFINQHKHRGFIKWDDVDDALQGAYITLGKAQEKVKQGDSEGAVLLCVAVLSIVFDVFTYCDDSGGTVGGVIGRSLKIIHEAVSVGYNKLNESEKEKIFGVLIKEARHSRYEDWIDWRLSVLRSCIHFCDNMDRRQKLED